MRAGGGSCPGDVPENVDVVAKPAEFCGIRIRSERLLFMRGIAESSAKRDSWFRRRLPRILNQPSPYGLNKGRWVCRSEAGGDASAKTQRGAAGQIPGRSLREGKVPLWARAPVLEVVSLIVKVSRRGNTRGRDAGLGRSRG